MRSLARTCAGLQADSRSRGPFDHDHPRWINPYGAEKPFRFLDNLFPVAPEDDVPDAPGAARRVSESDEFA